MLERLVRCGRLKVALRWKKNPRPSGLAGVFAGPQGSTLRIDGITSVATVNAHGYNSKKKGWFWVAGWDSDEIPYKNTCDEEYETEQHAKDAAMIYVRQHLST